MRGFEVSGFFESGNCQRTDDDPGAWLEGNRDYGARLEALPHHPNPYYRTTYYYDVRFIGRFSPPGESGHLERYPREVTIERVLEVRPSRRCPPPDGKVDDLFERVVFAPRSSAIGEPGERALRIVAAKLAGNPGIRRVEVVADVASTAKGADALARERTERVVSRLVAMGVAADRLASRTESLMLDELQDLVYFYVDWSTYTDRTP